MHEDIKIACAFIVIIAVLIFGAHKGCTSISERSEKIEADRAAYIESLKPINYRVGDIVKYKGDDKEQFVVIKIMANGNTHFNVHEHITYVNALMEGRGVTLNLKRINDKSSAVLVDDGALFEKVKVKTEIL